MHQPPVPFHLLIDIMANTLFFSWGSDCLKKHYMTNGNKTSPLENTKKRKEPMKNSKKCIFTFFFSARIFLSISGAGSCDARHSEEFDGALSGVEFAEIVKSFNWEATSSTGTAWFTSSTDETSSCSLPFSRAAC